MLNDRDFMFLKRLCDERRYDWAVLQGTASQAIDALVRRGYCQIEPMVSGPLRVTTGELMIRLTEAGRYALSIQAATRAGVESATSAMPSEAANS